MSKITRYPLPPKISGSTPVKVSDEFAAGGDLKVIEHTGPENCFAMVVSDCLYVSSVEVEGEPVSQIGFCGFLGS